jgi:hypothetical protein
MPVFTITAMQVVQPVFCFLSEQVDLMGSCDEEAALRIAYCDCNESLWKPGVVEKALSSLKRYGGNAEELSCAWRGLLQVRRTSSQDLIPKNPSQNFHT